MTDEERNRILSIYGEPDTRGHITRFSDSSLYDEKCVLCGMTDTSKISIYNTDCPEKIND